MAYGFNEDRSKAPVYTKAEIDAMDLADDQALQQEVADRQAAVSQEAATRQAGDSALDARVSNIIAQGQSTEGNTELIDIRTGHDGTEFVVAGDASRFAQLHSANLAESYALLKGIKKPGSIANDDGSYSSWGGYRLVSYDIVSYDTPITLVIENGFKIGLAFFDENDVYQTASGWKTGTYSVAANQKFRWQIARYTEDTQTRADINSFINAVKIKYSSKETKDIRNGNDGTEYLQAGDSVRFAQAAIEALGENTFVLPGVKKLGSLSSGVFSDWFKHRVTGDTIISFDHDIWIDIDEGWQLALHYFDDEDNFIQDSGWLVHPTSAYHIASVPAGYRFKWMISKIGEQTSDIANIPEFISHVRVRAVSEKDLYLSYGMDNLKHCLLWEIGSLDGNGKNYNTTWRLRSTIARLPFDTVIRIKDGFNFRIVTFSDNRYSDPVQSVWFNGPQAEFYMPANTWFRFQCAKVGQDNNTYVIGDIKSSEMFDAIIIEKAENRLFEYTPINDNYLSIAHQGFPLWTEYSNQSKVEGYKRAREHGFNAAECDVRFSADGVPVCCHDSTFVDTNDGTTTVTIANETLEQLKQHGFYNGTISTFDEVVCACKKYGLILDIDQLSGDYTDEQWQTVFDIVSKYQMQRYVIWNAGAYVMQEKIFAYDPYASILILATSSTINDVIEEALGVANDNNRVIIGCNYSGVSVDDVISWNKRIEQSNVELGLWTIDDPQIYAQFLPYVSFITSNRLCYKDIVNLL